uniref:Uncharacterized protein n=1 Tax=Oryza glumipatula TaxID=40148 RepID=A0A0D9ZTN7_9ORYZ
MYSYTSLKHEKQLIFVNVGQKFGRPISLRLGERIITIEAYNDKFLRDDPCCEEAFFTTVNGISSILFDSIFLSGLKHEKKLISAHCMKISLNPCVSFC